MNEKAIKLRNKLISDYKYCTLAEKLASDPAVKKEWFLKKNMIRRVYFKTFHSSIENTMIK